MKIDRVHFYTKNAAKIKDWFVRNVGFEAISHSKDGHTHTETIALNSACLVFSSPLTATSPVAQYLNSHPSGVADIAFRVDCLNSIVDRAYQLGLKIWQYPQVICSSQGIFKFAKIQGWNSLQHSLIEEIRGELNGCFVPSKEKERTNRIQFKITDIDHIVLNVAAGQLNSAVELYQKLFGFRVQQSFRIQSSSSGLYSQALIDESGNVKFNINEPTSANSQIQEFIDLNHGSGIQHLALRSQDLIGDVAQMQKHQMEFLKIPASYYQQLDPGLNLSLEERRAISQLQILADRDRHLPQSLLMQIFTQPIFEKPTFFLEFIERRQHAQGFGKGNFQALFEAVEREQTKV